MSFGEAKKDLCAGVFFSLLSLLFIFVVNKYGIDIPTANYQAGSAAVLPDFFPNMICWSTFFFSLGLVLVSLIAMRAAQASDLPAPEEVKEKEQEPGKKTSKVKTVAFRIAGMGTMFLLYYVVDFLGIIIAGFLFYLLYAGFTGERRPLRAIVGAAATTLVLYYFFVRVASVPMPLGLFSGIL